VTRVLLVVLLAGLVVVVALALQRRRPPQPAALPRTYEAPTHLVRDDFERPDAPWLVAVFTSATCSTCGDVWSKAELLGSDEVAVQQVEVSRHAALHRRYGIDAVPITVVADERGTVRRSFMGPVSSTHLWAAVAELREPGSVPPGCEGHDHPESDQA
jgi:hypothetical protein